MSVFEKNRNIIKQEIIADVQNFEIESMLGISINY